MAESQPSCEASAVAFVLRQVFVFFPLRWPGVRKVEERKGGGEHKGAASCFALRSGVGRLGKVDEYLDAEEFGVGARVDGDRLA